MPLSDTRWTLADQTLEAALEPPPSEQGEYIAGACGGDDELHALARCLAAQGRVEEAGKLLREERAAATEDGVRRHDQTLAEFEGAPDRRGQGEVEG